MHAKKRRIDFFLKPTYIKKLTLSIHIHFMHSKYSADLKEVYLKSPLMVKQNGSSNYEFEIE
jgi:hypothetical protein